MRKLWGWAASALVLGSAGSGALAQETTVPVGPPELRDFALPGTPPPSAQEEEPAAAPPPAAERAPQQAPAEQTPRQTTPVTISPPPPPPPRAREDSAPTPTAATDEPETAPEPLPLPEIAAEPVAPPADVAAPPPAAAPVVEDEKAPTSDFTWILAIAGLLAALAGLAKLWTVRKAKRAIVRHSPSVSELAVQRGADLPAPDAAAARPAPQMPRPSPPAAEPAAIPAGAAPPRAPAAAMPRPRVDILFKPAKAEATEVGASVHYELIVKNLGNMPARNVRIEARMFNGGADQEKAIGAFFKHPLQEKLAARPFEIPARSQAKLSRVVSIDRDHLRAITVQGRQLLIPMVAFNILYDWKDGEAEDETGQTSRCFVVGREAERPSDKMAPFRLDLGPRVYRTVGQRETALTRIA